MKIQTLMYCPKCTMQFQVVEPEILAKSRKTQSRCPECFIDFSHGEPSPRPGKKGKAPVAVCVTTEQAELKLMTGEWGNRSIPGGTT